MLKLNPFLVGLIVIIAITAIGQDAPFRVDPKTDFSKYKTYKWAPLDREASPIDNQIRVALDAELVKKGLKESNSDSADAVISYHSSFGTETLYRYHMYRENPGTLTIKTGEVAIDSTIPQPTS